MKQTLFLVALLAGTIPVTLVNPFVGLLVYYGFATLYPQHLWEDSLYPGVRWSMLIGVPTLVSFVAHGFARSRAGARWPLEKKLMAVLAALTGLSMIDAIDPELAGRQMYYYAIIFTMFFVGCALVDSRYRLHAMAIVLVATLGWVAFDFNQRYVLMHQTHILMRGFGALDNNGAATLMVMGMPFCVFLVTQERKWYFKAAALGALAVMLHMILFSMSRAAMLAGLLMLPLLLVRLSDRRLGISLLTVTAVLAVALAGAEVRSRFLSIADYRTDESAQIRLDAWKTGWRVIQDYPVLGVGPDCFRRVVGDYAYELKGRTMHNHFIQTAVDMGLPAAAAMIGALLASLWHLERMRR
ncbi:MAG: hypothetical protein GX591_03885, partial [Planctomycetes bacterium]|nr:hypothetical protein [Planctomycetota bacterium]